MLILFDIDDTLLDDTHATRLATDALHTQLQSEWSLEEFRVRWLDSIGRHFPRFLAGEISFEEQRRARIRDVVAKELADAEADDVFATYLIEYERHWRLFADVLPAMSRALLKLEWRLSGDYNAACRRATVANAF